MSDDHSSLNALAEGADVSPLEVELLEAIDQHEQSQAAWRRTSDALRRPYERLLSAWLFPGAQLDTAYRGKDVPRCLQFARVSVGVTAGATLYRIESAPRVTIAPGGSPLDAGWACDATPIRRGDSATPAGKTAAGRVTIGGPVFTRDFTPMDLDPAAARIRDRDDFMRMAADAAAILCARSEP